MDRVHSRRARSWKFALPLMAIAGVVVAMTAGTTQAGPTAIKVKGPTFTDAVAFDVSKPLRELAKDRKAPAVNKAALSQGPDGIDFGSAGPPSARAARAAAPTATRVAGAQQAPSAMPPTIANFEGLNNHDNFNVFGFRVNPPDPNGDVGPNHYVEIINLVFAVYSKTGTLLLGPVDTGALWAGFAVPDCTDPSGDPIVLYDQFVDRWIITQFTTRGFDDEGNFNGLPFYNCVAVSQTGDPTGAYFRYAFITSQPGTTSTFFPDYPKYGVWTDSYVLTSRDFGSQGEYGIGVYALEKNKMVNGQPEARAVQFFLDGNDPAVLPLVGDGLLPADIDGKQKPKTDTAIPIVGTQDDGAGYGGTFDALNIWDLYVTWRSTPVASLALKTQLPTAPFDSIYPCGVVPGSQPPSSRDCLPQPGVTDGSQYLDILSYRQRPIWRLAYRNFKNYESLVTNQSVEAAPSVGGTRWYEIRRTGGTYSVHQQGTVFGSDVHRWMGSIAQDKKGNMALGYSVVNGTDVFPGIRYTGRLAGDPLGTMPQGEGTIINGSGVQTNVNSRWGDYTSMNVDPVDDCTFWYVNEYYSVTEPPPDRNWQTRIASFKFPGC
jgi:hypothetical protein